MNNVAGMLAKFAPQREMAMHDVSETLPNTIARTTANMETKTPTTHQW